MQYCVFKFLRQVFSVGLLSEIALYNFYSVRVLSSNDHVVPAMGIVSKTQES
jgi:hypothetical protein